MKGDPTPWFSPSLKWKSEADDIPNSVHARVSDGVSWLLFIWLNTWSLEELIHSEFHPSQRDRNVDVKHQKRTDLFWNLIESFRRYSTACSCASYCVVELLRPVAHIRPCKPSPKFRTWDVLNSHFYEPSSTYFIEVLIWGNQDLNLLVEATYCLLMKWNWRHLLSYSI